MTLGPLKTPRADSEARPGPLQPKVHRDQMDDGPGGQAHGSQGRTNTAGEELPGLEGAIPEPAEELCSPAGPSSPLLEDFRAADRSPQLNEMSWGRCGAWREGVGPGLGSPQADPTTGCCDFLG